MRVNRQLNAKALAWIVGALLMRTEVARADATTGIWPNLSVPPESKQANASSDAAVIIGIDEYDALPHIPGAADNARDWEKYMLFGRHIPPERIALLTDHEATVDAITRAAKDMSSRVLEGGTLHIIFIGHGAPGAAGSKGLLLGSDVRPSEQSFDARSISYDKLLEVTSAGKQAETVLVLDACFSGVSNEGKTLIRSVQPVVAVNLVETPKTVVLTAGSSAEYAGALPGSQRPAFSYLVLGGLRGWADNDHDGKISAKEIVNYAKLVLRSLPNNHTQTPSLVTSTPDVSLDEGPSEAAPDLSKQRALVETWKPPSTATDAELHVAAKCLRDRVVGVEDGLIVTIDGATLAPIGEVRDGAGNLTALRYRAPPGAHHLYVRAPDCEAFTGSATLVAGETRDVAGGLGSTETGSSRPPFGKLDHLMVTFEPTFRESIYGKSNIDSLYTRDSGSTFSSTLYQPHAQFGARVAVGAAFSYFEIAAGLGVSAGAWSVRRQSTYDVFLSEATASFTEVEPSARLGLRVALGQFALRPIFAQIGPAFISGNGGAGNSISLTDLHISGGFGLDWAFLCDWSAHADLGPGVLLPVHADDGGGDSCSASAVR